MIYDEYAAYLRKYKSEFGDRTIVLLECGSFFEIYDDGSGATNMKDVCDMLNIIVSRRNKAILEVSRTNFEMAGFPSHALKKFVSILLNNNYTVVLVRQVTPPPNPKRQVTEILSPGTCLDVTSMESNNLMVVCIDETEKYNALGTNISIGCACIDVTTGTAFVYETTTFNKDASYVFDELQRLLIAYAPKELEIMSVEPLKTLTFEKLQDKVNMDNVYVHDKLGCNTKYGRPQYQLDVLSQVYSKTGLLNVIEYLELEKHPLATVSFTRAIEFAHLHNENIVQHMPKPQLLTETDCLLLSNTCIQQLDIFKPHGQHLLGLLNTSRTAIGRRYFRNRILSPRVSHAALDRDFDKMDGLNDTVLKDARDHLCRVYDLERLFRRCVLGRLHPHELFNVYVSLVNLEKVQGCFQERHTIIEEMIQYIDMTFDTTKLPLYNMDTIDTPHMFRDPSDEMLQYASEIQASLDVFQRFADACGDGVMKLDVTDKDGCTLTTTPKRFQEVSKSFINKGDIQGMRWKDLTTKTMTSCVKVSHPVLEKHNNILIATKQKLSKCCTLVYQSLIKSFEDRFINSFRDVVSVVEQYDWWTTCKHNANTWRLTRPRFETKTCGSVKVTGLRHLLIEHCQKTLQYVTNDVHLDNNGMLLYGINSSGKSSLMKAVGLAVIMAQEGMYVPCDEMTLAQFTRIFTRILTCDDIQRGHSTFTKEIVELRNILQRSDERSLVIGDELCAGTESASALAIVASGIDRLIQRQSCFLFATHLHDLVDVPEVQQHVAKGKLDVCHLAVHCDPATKVLVYDRKLQKGNGSSLYGIEVCRAMDMDDEFIKTANAIRQRYLGVVDELTVGKNSRYNASLHVKRCQVCGGEAHEVHHIRQQKDADQQGYIGTFHKNARFNLTCLCEKCHDDVHNGSIIIKGYTQTSCGVQLTINHDDCGSDFDLLKRDITRVFSDSAFKTKKARYEFLMQKWNVSKYKIDKMLMTPSK